MPLQAIKFAPGAPEINKPSTLQILDQLLIPYQESYITLSSAQDAHTAIKSMCVRGAPAIAIVAALSLSVELSTLLIEQKLSDIEEEVGLFIKEKLKYLLSSRPTAVNLTDAAEKLGSVVDGAVERADQKGVERSGAVYVVEAYSKAAEKMLIDDVKDNISIGDAGARWIVENTEAGRKSEGVKVLTHCNTGSLATAGYGTALGVIRSLHTKSALKHAFCTETRPYNQGARLTAYELVHDSIPATLVTDSMAGALLKREASDMAAIIVGADRVAANGDTANKIGTYALAVLARFHGIKFLVAAPRTTVDRKARSGSDIVIEERPHSELANIKGPQLIGTEVDVHSVATVSIAAPGISIWNPAFDVTPAELIDGIVTEVGVIVKSEDGKFNMHDAFAI